MSPTNLLAFYLFALVAAVTPGPSNLLVLSAGAQNGWRVGLRCLAGVVAGMALLIALTVGGLGALLQARAEWLALLRWAGSAFLLWLAWQVATAPPLSEPHDVGHAGFWRALGFQWMNPKSWIVGASAATSFGGSIEASPLMRGCVLGAVFALAAAPPCAVWLAFGSALHRKLADARSSRLFHRTLGALLALSVLSLHT